MHFAVIAEGVPHTFHGGGGVTVYSALLAMSKLGHRVTVIALGSSDYNGPRTEDEHIAHLRSLGCEVIILPKAAAPPPAGKLRELMPTLGDVFPAASRAAQVAELVARARVDGVFMYHWDPIAAALGVRGIPKVGVVGDPVHLPALFRRHFREKYSGKGGPLRRLKEAVKERLLVRSQLSAMRTLLNSCEASGAFAAHHAAMFRADGSPGCAYYRTPTPDPFPEAGERRQGTRFKIMHIGHLRGTATVSGVEMLAEGILPILKARLPADSFEIHLVGGYFETLPEALRAKLSDPLVKVRGQISPPDEEFLTSHVVLVPTAIELGIRVRIITAFSFGSCIVAHEANRAGIPELEHGKNGLIGADAAALAEHCIALFRDPDRRRALEEGSRATYDRHFSLDTAGKRIADSLIGLAGAGTSMSEPVRVG